MSYSMFYKKNINMYTVLDSSHSFTWFFYSLLLPEDTIVSFHTHLFPHNLVSSDFFSLPQNINVVPSMFSSHLPPTKHQYPHTLLRRCSRRFFLHKETNARHFFPLAINNGHIFLLLISEYFFFLLRAFWLQGTPLATFTLTTDYKTSSAQQALHYLFPPTTQIQYTTE